MIVIVFFCIVLFFIVLLSFSLTIYVSIQEEVSIAIGAFGYRRKLNLDEEEKPKKKKAKKKVAKEVKKKTQKPTKKAHKFSFQETVEFVLTLMKSIFKPTAKLLKHLRITKLSLNMTVCGEEAAQTAILFGQVNTAIYNLLAHLDNLITLQIKEVNIVPDFVSDEAKYDITFKVKLRFWHIIVALVCMLAKFLANTIKNNLKKEKNENPTNDQTKKYNKRKDIHLKDE